jgi:hypothetical protein
MDGICKITDHYYGTIPADDCSQERIAVKVDRAGNRTDLSGPLPEAEAEQAAEEQHQQDLSDNGQFGEGA